MFIFKSHIHLGVNQAQPLLAMKGGKVGFICRLIRKGYKNKLRHGQKPWTAVS